MENARFTIDVEADEHALHEVYLPHFKTVINAGADSVMSAYNSVNGTWAGDNKTLLTTILRDEWGFRGTVISDFVFGLRDPVGSVEAGLDVEMPLRQQRARALPKALRDGRLSRDAVRRAGRRILAMQIRHAAQRDPEAPDRSTVARPSTGHWLVMVAARGAVLLKNAGRRCALASAEHDSAAELVVAASCHDGKPRRHRAHAMWSRRRPPASSMV